MGDKPIPPHLGGGNKPLDDGSQYDADEVAFLRECDRERRRLNVRFMRATDYWRVARRVLEDLRRPAPAAEAKTPMPETMTFVCEVYGENERHGGRPYAHLRRVDDGLGAHEALFADGWLLIDKMRRGRKYRITVEDVTNQPEP